MYTNAQTRIRRNGTIIERSNVCIGRHLMWLIIVLFIAGAALLIGSRLRVPGGVNPAHLGWMSAQWLAEYRASQRM
jgi:TRAP-type mannitol/chloroaromatic compound transport system permease small subunit